MNKTLRMLNRATALAALVFLATPGLLARQEKPTGQGFSFRTGVELINVTTTVTDSQGRFVPGLTVDDFELYEDGKLQQVSQFESQRVPVSLGIALDTSGSMVGERIAAAQSAVNRFLYDLLGDQDEVFLYRFSSRPELVHGWTDDRRSVGRALGSVSASGGTAMYDTVAEAMPLFRGRTRPKKALVVISDGNDTSSHTAVAALQERIRETEVLVYAIGMDASGSATSAYAKTSSQPSGPLPVPPAKKVPVPAAFPGAPIIRTPVTSKPSKPGPSALPGRSGYTERFNVEALRAITDDSGGRTEIIVSASDLGPATAGIANELSRQYFLGYTTSAPKDGRWHSIEVRLKKGNYTIRARKGFIAG